MICPRYAVCVLPLLAFSAFASDKAIPFIPSEEQSHQEVLAGGASYTVDVGGTADMDNTATRQHATWSIGFQNNVALEIANTGDVPVDNPRIVTNGKRDWHSAGAILAEFTEGAKSPQETIYLIWEGLRQNRHHDYPLFGSDYHDPVRFLNIYGGGFCDDSGASGAALYSAAGFNKAAGGEDPFQRGLHGHVMCEVWHDGDYQFMDIDQEAFYLDRENRKPVSGDAIVRDHDLSRRELAFGPQFRGWDAPLNSTALFGSDDVRTAYWSTGHEMSYTLRPGERIVFYWDRPGKTPWDLYEKVHRYFSNSVLIFDLPADPGRLANGGVTLTGFDAGEAGLVAVGEAASLTIPVDTAYTICGATLTAGIAPGPPVDAAIIVELSLDGVSFSEVARQGASAGSVLTVPLDTAMQVSGGPPKRKYWVRIRCEQAAGATLANLRLSTDLYAYPIALPRLSVGSNTVRYTDDTAGAHEVTVTHRWRESGNIIPPVPPAVPQSPEPGENVAATRVPFAWPAVEGCDAYWLRVSRDPAMRYPYRPNYDVVLDTNRYEVPFRGMFSPGEMYYWRVRPRLRSGLWGDWSATWTFTWSGPTVPRDVTLSEEDGGLTLHWAANPTGTRPDHYRVYASNEKGFSIGTEATQNLDPGPPPFFAETTANAMPVVGPDLDSPLANHAFYRVVAIDMRGVESCPSDYAEVPRPWIYSRPVTVARAGALYRYTPQAITSIGDWQHRYDKPGNAFWEKETLRISLTEGPEWLSVDPDTGCLHGTPPDGTAGTFPIALHLQSEFADEVPEGATDAQSFRGPEEAITRNCDHVFVLEVSE